MTICDQNSNDYIDTLKENLSSLPAAHFRSEITEIAADVNLIQEAIEVREHFAAVKEPGETDGLSIAEDARKKSLIAVAVKQYQALKTNPEFQCNFASLDKLANSIYTQIAGVFNTLNDVISPEVTALTEQVDAIMRANLARDNKEIVINQVQEVPQGNFEVLTWDRYFNTLGGIEIIAQNYKDLFKLDQVTGNIQDTNVDWKSPDVSTTPIEFTDETRNYIIGAWKEGTGDIDEAELVRTLNYITAYDSNGDSIVGSTIGSLVNGIEYRTVIHNCTDILDHCPALIERLRRIPLNLSDGAIADLTRNFDVISNQFTVAAYVLQICRNILKSNWTVIIDAHTVNGDMMEYLQESNITMSDLAVFLVVFYTRENIDIPNTGITFTEINDNLESAKARFNEGQQRILQDAAVVRAQYRAAAVKEALYQHIEETDETRIPNGVTKEDFITAQKNLIDASMSRLDSSDNNNLNSFLFRFVIDTYYPGSIVAIAHQYFGTSVTNALQAKAELNEQDMNVITASVAARLAADFIFKEIVCAHREEAQF